METRARSSQPGGGSPAIQFATARDGTRIAYTRIHGDSPPWLHIYSLGAPTIELDFSIPARLGYITNLAQGRATVLYDHRGSGFSGPLTGSLTLDDLVDDLAAVTAAVGEPMDVSVMGTGCFPAIQYAACDGRNWRSMVIHGAILRFAGSYQDRYQAIWRDGSYTGYLRSAARATMEISPLEVEPVVTKWLRVVPPETRAAYVDAVRDVDLTETARRVSIPTLNVWPEGSDGGRTVTALIPGARLAHLSSLINRPRLGTEIRGLWDAHIGASFGPACNTGSAAGPLSPREREVLALIAGGKTHAQIAQALTIAPMTASRHVHNILEKLDDLTRRETEILALIAAGKTNGQIAEALAIAPSTVDRHVQNIYGKTGVHNRAEATLWAVAHGLVSL